MSHSRLRHAALLSAAFLAIASLPIAAQTVTIERDPTGVIVRNGAQETVHITVCGENVIHVVAGPGDPRGASPDTPWITTPCTPKPFDFAQGAKEGTLKTAQMQIGIQYQQGLLLFRDAAGHQLLNESFRRPRVYIPETLNGESLYRVSDRFMPQALEGFYGLGQHQSGAFNYNGNVVELA